MPTRPVILIIDEDRALASAVSAALNGEGLASRHAQDARTGLDVLRHEQPDLVLLSQTLPDVKGTEVCRELRRTERTRSTPIIFLAANDSELERVVAFELGMDDYVPKPFSMRELVLRVRALLRRVVNTETQPTPPPQQQDWIRVDPEGHQVWVDGREITLTVVEFRLLIALLRGRGRVLTRSQLLEDAWGTASGATNRAVDTGIKRLRGKLGDAGSRVEAVRRLGYRIKSPHGDR